MKKVAIQIVTFNSKSEIIDCLESIMQQTYIIDDIVVVDNNSIDNTTEIIESSQFYKNIKLVKNKENSGFSGGHNQALKLTKSDYVLVLNPDVQLHPDYVYQIVKVMENDTKLGSATGKLYREPMLQILDSTGLIIKKNRRAFDRGAEQIDRGQFDTETDIFGVSGAAAMYRRKMIEEVSINGDFFDESFFAYKEDVDVAWRSLLMGWKATFVPESIAFHKRGWQLKKNRLKISVKIRRHSYINRYYTILKNDSFSYFILHLPIILIYEVLSIGYAIVKEREILKEWYDFKRNCREMLKKRQMIKSKQKVRYSEIFHYFRGIW